MTAPSLNSPLSLNGSSNSSVDRQDNVSSSPNPTQPEITTVLDGSGRNLTCQSDPTCRDSYSDFLKFGVAEQEQSFPDQIIPQPVHTPNPGSVIPNGIILTNLTAILPTDDPSLVLDPLDALNEDVLDDMEAKNNADLYLNLHNIEDIEMSSDSTKRKRSEDGEEAISQAT
ncbi:hypothetical protein Cgig2_028064 [Carnegiea gigantea]|uniref:Uncharacterized protein n=1 Tax=Carnegiea gigantea TaxID=171969 RepID=A0A9Q1GR97_9CARY|nr:hypothetical protein Cgig2_028064 [Carnegiea gigantea]